MRVAVGQVSGIYQYLREAVCSLRQESSDQKRKKKEQDATRGHKRMVEATPYSSWGPLSWYFSNLVISESQRQHMHTCKVIVALNNESIIWEWHTGGLSDKGGEIRIAVARAIFLVFPVPGDVSLLCGPTKLHLRNRYHRTSWSPGPSHGVMIRPYKTCQFDGGLKHIRGATSRHITLVFSWHQLCLVTVTGCG